jgi:ATP-binding cassette subfamily F protein uup
MGNPNVLMFDEPTNDFDIATLAALEEYLEYFKGVLLIVSHDRSFLDRTVNRIFSFEDDIIKEYPGNYSAYLEKIEQKKTEHSQEMISKPKEQVQQEKSSKKKGLTFNEKREFETLESTISQKEDHISSINEQLAETPPEQFKKFEELSLLHAKTEQELENAMLRWMELSEKSNSN